jgi:hypothetical protein
MGVLYRWLVVRLLSVGRLSPESDAPIEQPPRVKDPFENTRKNMNEGEIKSAFFSRRNFLQFSVIGGAGLLINCQNNGQKEGRMNSKAETNAAMPANQSAAVQETSVKGEYASVNGLKMYYEIHGAGRPLVLLHGSFMSGTNYPTLSQGRQVIVVDMQGHGRTADIDRPFTFEQMADDMAALLKHLKIEQTDVFGYSMGGTIGLALAIRHPSLVGGWQF